MKNKSNITLRPYQQECVDTMINYQGTSALVVLATALGKTVIFTDYIKYETKNNDRRILILSHRDELVYSPVSYLKGISVGFETADIKSNGEQIITASVQTIVNRLKNFNEREFDIIIVDEAHHAVAPTYRKILNYFKGTKNFGFTATTKRGDGVGLSHVFDDIIFERDLKWGMDNKYLTPIVGMQARLKYKLESVKIIDGEFNSKDIAKAMSGTAMGVAEIYTKHAVGQTIIFSSSIKEGEQIVKFINEKHGNIARQITATTKNRDLILHNFEVGKIKVIVNFAVLTEGTDLPCTQTIIIARPIAHTNPTVYSQMVGRGLRLYEGKEFCKVVDCVGISNVPICTSATLLGKELKEPTKKNSAQNPIPETGEQLEYINTSEIPDTFIKKEKEVDIMNMEKSCDMHGVNWYKTPNGEQVVSLRDITFIIDVPDEDGNVKLIKNATPAQSRKPLQFVYDYVRKYLEDNHEEDCNLWDKAKFKDGHSIPISERQIDLIYDIEPQCTVDLLSLTAKDATQYISYLMVKRRIERQNNKNGKPLNYKKNSNNYSKDYKRNKPIYTKSSKPASEKQIEFINKLMPNNNFDFSKMTSKQASEYITKITDK